MCIPEIDASTAQINGLPTAALRLA